MAAPYKLALDEEWDELKKLYKERGSFSLSLPQTPVGDTAFHLAVFSKSKEPLQSFLSYVRTDPMMQKIYWAKNIYGNTALHEAAAVGNIEAVKILVEYDDELLEDRNDEGESPLFKAAAYGQTEVVLHLAGEYGRALKDNIHRHRKKPEADKPEASILHAAIQGEHFETALVLLILDESLATLKDGNGMTSLQLLATMPSAFRSGYRMSMWKRLLYCTYIEEKRRIGLEKLKQILEAKRKHDADKNIQGEHFETASKLLDLDESLATLEDGNGTTSLLLLATMPSAFGSGYRMSIWERLLYFCPLIDAKRRIRLPILKKILEDKRKHELAFELARMLIERDTTWQEIVEKHPSDHFEELGNNRANQGAEGGGSKPIAEGGGSKPIALFLATERGIVEIVNEILKQTPQLVEYIDDKNRNMLHIAIMHRQKELFDLVKEMNIPMKRLVRGIEKGGDTILHQAADKINDNADIHRGPAYHLQEELKWYKRVEKLAPTHYAMFYVARKDDHKEEKNYNCKELFNLKHDGLLNEAQKWVKETSQSCSAVAVLVATVVFAAAYTVPGGSNDEGYPVFLNNNFFLVFTVMDVVALACSLTSVVMFLSVLTSPFSYEEFHHRLPRKLTVGFSLLFVALTTTMLAFAATLLLIVRFQKPRWTATLIFTAAFFPVSIFALSQFPMYVAFKITFLKFYKWLKKVLPPKWYKKKPPNDV